MKLLLVTFLPQLNKNSPIADITKALNGIEEYKIDSISWPLYQYRPDVSFKMAYARDCIFLKYFVTENEIRITAQHDNDAVYRDSCVEFFISFGEKEYYNFEFNSIGTCLAAFGEDREKRNFLPDSVIEKINFNSSLTATKTAGKKVIIWELTLIMPIDVFCFHKFDTLQGINCFGNFYKCADDQEIPHYLSWNPIISPNPDFHLKQFFGSIKFA